MWHRALIELYLNDAFRFEVAKGNAMGWLRIGKIRDIVAVRKPDAAGDIVVTSSPDNESRIRL